MSFTRRPGSGRPRQTSHREDRHIVRNARVQPTASSAALQAQVAPSLETSASSRTIQRRLAEGHLGSRRPLHVLLLTPTHRHLLFGVVPRMKKLDYSRMEPESRFDLSSDGNRIRVWRPRGERFNPALALQRTHHSTSDVMVWGAIAYNTRSLLVLIRGTMTAQRYVHDILQPDVLPLLQWLPGGRGSRVEFLFVKMFLKQFYACILI
ncbi:UNVERIFIED_CONTAM: Transposable element Tcb2 transposase [Trichonephila clavipes]